MTLTRPARQSATLNVRGMVSGAGIPAGLRFEGTGTVEAAFAPEQIGFAVTANKPLNKRILADDHFKIMWQVQAAGGPWIDVGESENTLYVTLFQPLVPLHHTVIEIGARQAHGIGAGSISSVADLVFAEFSDRDVRRVRPARHPGVAPIRMTYWQDWAGGCNTALEMLAAEPAIDVQTGMLRSDGRCTAWAGLFLRTIRVLGIDWGAPGASIDGAYGDGTTATYAFDMRRVEAHPNALADSVLLAGVTSLDFYLIQKWQPTGQSKVKGSMTVRSDPSSPSYFSDVYRNTRFVTPVPMSTDPDVFIDEANEKYLWDEASQEYDELPGIAGQGNPDPRAIFNFRALRPDRQHAIVRGRQPCDRQI